MTGMVKALLEDERTDVTVRDQQVRIVGLGRVAGRGWEQFAIWRCMVLGVVRSEGGRRLARGCRQRLTL